MITPEAYIDIAVKAGLALFEDTTFAARLTFNEIEGDVKGDENGVKFIDAVRTSYEKPLRNLFITTLKEVISRAEKTGIPVQREETKMASLGFHHISFTVGPKGVN